MNKDVTPTSENNAFKTETADEIRQPKIVGNEAALRDAILEVAPAIATFEYIRSKVWPEVPHPKHFSRLSTVASSLREKLRLSTPPKKLINIRGEGYIITD